jgi:predicted amidophosphoribosyltransferase
VADSRRPEPAGFPGCGRCQLRATGTPAECAACVSRSVPLPASRCAICSRPLKDGEACRNPICGFDDRGFGQIYAICPKRPPIEKAIWRFKYDGKDGWGVIFGRLVLGWLDTHLHPDDYDLIVANPTHASRPVRHTERILEVAASEDTDGIWPIKPRALVKMKETGESAGKGARWRQKWDAANELEGAIRRGAGVDFTGQRILVFDDITTTCAQMHVLGQMLQGWGADEVDGLVIARSV